MAVQPGAVLHGSTIAVEDPRQDDIRILIRELNETLLKLTPQEFCHHMSVDEMAEAHTTVFVARNNETSEAMACGALRRHGGGIAEVKRMYTRPLYRGLKLGRTILEQVEGLARKEGYQTLVLETGTNFDAAISLYKSQGFQECGPVVDYAPSPHTAFFQKRLRL